MLRGELQGHTWLLMMMMRKFGGSVVRTLLAWPLAGVSQGQENAVLKIPQKLNKILEAGSHSFIPARRSCFVAVFYCVALEQTGAD
jgi:hypothetical protein